MKKIIEYPTREVVDINNQEYTFVGHDVSDDMNKVNLTDYISSVNPPPTGFTGTTYTGEGDVVYIEDGIIKSVEEVWYDVTFRVEGQQPMTCNFQQSWTFGLE